MSLSVKYSGSTELKLREVLWEMMSEALSTEPEDAASARVADLVGEVVQLVALCKEYHKGGMKKRYDMHIYASEKGVEWQYFSVDL